MAILEIKTFPEEVLKQVASPVTVVTPTLARLADDMLETMYAAPGIGLAAPQVGQSLRLIVLDTRMYDDRGGLDAERMTVLEMLVQFPLRLFNPVIVKREGKTTFEEACLSVPGFSENVTRANYIEVEATKSDNSKVVIKTDGLLAICLQHEIDHLDGKLFIDRLSTIKRGLIKSKIKKHGYPAREPGSKHLL